MAKKKNYLDNEELKNEILECITKGYNTAVANGYEPKRMIESDDPEEQKKITDAIKLGYMPERSAWIQDIRKFEKMDLDELISLGEISKEDADKLKIQMQKPIVSDKLGRMFQLIVENVARGFYWANPDDGLDCKSNALLDLCSNFWKFEPVDTNGKVYNAFAFCTQISYFGIAGAHRILHPKKYDGTISMSCLDENGKTFDLYNL